MRFKVIWSYPYDNLSVGDIVESIEQQPTSDIHVFGRGFGILVRDIHGDEHIAFTSQLSSL